MISLSEFIEREDRAFNLLVTMLDSGSFEVSSSLTGEGVCFVVGDQYVRRGEVSDLLEKLVELGVFERVEHGSVVTCPGCGSCSLATFYVCPRCGSLSVSSVQLLIHTVCGYIDTSKNFVRGGRFFCPGCGREVPAEELKVFGSCFSCDRCGARFESPEVKHRCLSCGREFSKFEAVLEPLYTYRIRRDVVSDVIKVLIVKVVTDVLSRYGFSTQVQGRIQGASGVEHVFDVVAVGRFDDRELRLYVDICPSADAASTALSSLFGKSLDVRGDAFILIHPSIGRALDTSATQNLYAIDFLRIGEIGEKFTLFIESLLEEKGARRREGVVEVKSEVRVEVKPEAKAEVEEVAPVPKLEEVLPKFTEGAPVAVEEKVSEVEEKREVRGSEVPQVPAISELVNSVLKYVRGLVIEYGGTRDVFGDVDYRVCEKVVREVTARGLSFSIEYVDGSYYCVCLSPECCVIARVDPGGDVERVSTMVRELCETIAKWRRAVSLLGIL